MIETFLAGLPRYVLAGMVVLIVVIALWLDAWLNSGSDE